MNFNIYLEDELANDLIVIAKKSGKTRNSLVREAIHEYVNKQHHLQWSEKSLILMVLMMVLSLKVIETNYYLLMIKEYLLNVFTRYLRY